ncbi:methylated-DNA--[protein]-cysteine S-methyltransferase [Phytoactinopolyspora limicola]|uniref:methylated-DNA--[protein]-cysteine S-methyltransferase n=1 Tax=Phytoactinopolyspora limicola TaxID=2715536 RepID=UPI00140E8878|nr:methylated-DNA--[protein]-cysteine S-methyltransferase [Phytoactinopolyspora limicola]
MDPDVSPPEPAGAQERPTPDDIGVAGLATPVGTLSVAVTRIGVAAVSWSEPDELRRRYKLPMADDTARTRDAVSQLSEYFTERRRTFDLPLDWRFTSSAGRSVLHVLHATVGYGASLTYAELAERHGGAIPARAIGGIMGANPIPIVVPCHRVVAHDGLGGYSGGNGDGLEVKRWLLGLEGVLPRTLDWDG